MSAISKPTAPEHMDTGHHPRMMVTIPPSRFQKVPGCEGMYLGTFGAAGKHLREATGVKDSGFFHTEGRAINGIKVSMISGLPEGSTAGITFSHGTGDDEVPIQTRARVIHVDGVTGDANAYHCVHAESMGPQVAETHGFVPIEQSGLEDSTDVISRANRWSDMTPENVTAGVTSVTHTNTDGTTVTRHLIPAEAPDGTKNAIHRLIEMNSSAGSKFCDGAFTPAKRKIINGKTVMGDNHYLGVSAQLKDALTVSSPWEGGVNTNLFVQSDSAPSNPVHINLEFTRGEQHNPLVDGVPADTEGPVVPGEDSKLTTSDAEQAFNFVIPGETIRPDKKVNVDSVVIEEAESQDSAAGGDSGSAEDEA